MISKSQISYIKSLQQKKFRKEHQQFIVEGDKLCDEFLQSDYSIQGIYVLESKREKYELLLSKLSKNIEIVLLKQEDIDKLSNMSTSPEVLMLVDIPKESLVSDIPLEVFTNNLVLVLDGVKDPGNMGTILRIADWFGISHVVCSEDCVELYNPKVVQSTMGSLLRTNVYYTNLEEFLSSKSEVSIFGALLEGENIYSYSEKINGVLVMGSESHGISKQLLPLINKPVTIPSFGEAESLNVAIATGILCSEAKRRDI